MRKAFSLMLLMVGISLPALAQNVFTTTQDGCGAKNIGYCRVPVASEPASDVIAVTFDNRSQGGRLQLNTATNYVLFQGTYTDFTGNPDGSHNPYSGVGYYDGTAIYDSTGATPNGAVHGKLLFHAYWVGTCSGRGCGPIVVGWHYAIDSGSTLTTTGVSVDGNPWCPPDNKQCKPNQKKPDTVAALFPDGSDPMPICRYVKRCL